MFRLQVDAIRQRIVVDHDGLLRGVGHGAYVQHGFARIRHVDQGRHEHEPGHAQLVGAFDIAQRFTGAGFRYVGQDGHAAARGVQRDLRDLQFFFQRQGAGLTQRAARDHAMDAVADLEVDVLRGAFGIDPFVGVELGGDGGKNAGPAGMGHEELLVEERLKIIDMCLIYLMWDLKE
ncbi:hypothetical protein D3C72_1818920 [compost metagenome]